MSSSKHVTGQDQGGSKGGLGSPLPSPPHHLTLQVTITPSFGRGMWLVEIEFPYTIQNQCLEFFSWTPSVLSSRIYVIMYGDFIK